MDEIDPRGVTPLPLHRSGQNGGSGRERLDAIHVAEDPRACTLTRPRATMP
jgi:hypothetical protein